MTKAPILILLSVFAGGLHLVGGQRSLLHWKQDLEYKLNFYHKQVESLAGILESSIYPLERQVLEGPARVIRSGGNVRFSDLIIPEGALIMDPPLGQATIRVLANRTSDYVRFRMGALEDVQARLALMKRDLESPAHRYIYKGLPPNYHNQLVYYQNSSQFPGAWSFRQLSYAHVVSGQEVELKQVNWSSVDRVLAKTYMEDSKINPRDSHSRLFFEGRKTLYKSVFERKLKSGCCDRLKPLHTSRMMTRTADQRINSPAMFTSAAGSAYQPPVAIRKLRAERLLNRQLLPAIDAASPILQTPPDNFIQLNDLIHLRQPNQPEVFKTLVFRDNLLIDDASLAYSNVDNRLLVGYATASDLRNFDLSHDNYLLRFAHHRNNLTSMQQVAGRLLLQSETHFLAGLDAQSVNMVGNFQSFVQNEIIRTDRAPNVIRGAVQVDALPAMFNSPRGVQSVPILSSAGNLQVAQLNGMRVPEDLVYLPALAKDRPILVSGSRSFLNSLVVHDFLTVDGKVDELRMPQDVIPLHHHDSIGSLGRARVAFLDGLVAQQMTIQGGHLDEINLKDTFGDAQSLIFRSVFSAQADGSQLIRAPLRVMNLLVSGRQPDGGLVNGFKPESLLEFSRQPAEQSTIMGTKSFLAPVEANECIFSNVNQLANWTNHLIRIDRPNTVQLIHKKLAFLQPDERQAQLPPASLNLNRLSVDFYPNQSPQLFRSNVNFSPEFYVLQQALQKATTNNTQGRYRVLDRVQLFNGGYINGINLNDIITLDAPFRFSDKFTLVGKVEVRNALKANRIQSNYPLDAMDLVQFHKYRIPIMGLAGGPIKLGNLVLEANNKASFVQCHMLNGIPFSQFARSIMSLTQPQLLDGELLFSGPVNFNGLVRTESALNGMANFKNFASKLKNVIYSFENGLQCNSVMINHI